MPGLVPGIFFAATKKDRRDKPGDDENGEWPRASAPGDFRDLVGLAAAGRVDLDAIAAAGRDICVALGREPASKVAQALKARQAA